MIAFILGLAGGYLVRKYQAKLLSLFVGEVQ
jgi:hypothetical protein